MKAMKPYQERAAEYDQADALSPFRRKFFDAGEQMIYLDGNSLGRLPLATLEHNAQLLREQWGSRLIRSWNEHWMDLPSKIAAKIARIIGAGKMRCLSAIPPPSIYINWLSQS